MRRMRTLSAVILALQVATLARAGDVNLEWRPGSSCVDVGEIVLIKLYAAPADGETNQSMSGIDAIISWNPAVLQLLGVTNNGPYAWLQSTFFSDSGLDGLNNTWSDGNAFYTALANFVTPAQATPAGLHVTTFRFQALAGGDSQIEILATFPQNTQTVVYGGDFVGQRVTGSLGSGNVSVCDAPPTGDMNGDGSVNGEDIEYFVPALLASSAVGADVCPGDFNDNNVMDVGDVGGMVSALLNAP